MEGERRQKEKKREAIGERLWKGEGMKGEREGEREWKGRGGERVWGEVIN